VGRFGRHDPHFRTSGCSLCYAAADLAPGRSIRCLPFCFPRLHDELNSADVAMDVLIHISQQPSNSTTPAYVPAAFTVSSNAAAVNVLFFLSLVLVLIDAFLSMLVKSWLREFDRGWKKYNAADLRAKERQRRLQGLKYWKLPELVALFPVLIQGSLLLFCIGFLVLLFPLHLPSAILSLVTLTAGLVFYLFTTYVSIVDKYAPFSSPVSRGLTTLANILQAAWTTCNLWHNISGISFHSSRHQGHYGGADSPQENMQPIPGNNRVTNLCSLHTLRV
jgi:Family of unknown function (DUF6535)